MRPRAVGRLYCPHEGCAFSIGFRANLDRPLGRVYYMIHLDRRGPSIRGLVEHLRAEHLSA